MLCNSETWAAEDGVKKSKHAEMSMVWCVCSSAVRDGLKVWSLEGDLELNVSVR